MRTRDIPLANEISDKLELFQKQYFPLPGIKSAEYRDCLIEQIISSMRRIKYILVIDQRDISPLRLNPSSEIFDPLKAAIQHKRSGNIEEAFWLIFIATHFGKHKTAGWDLTRRFYGQINGDNLWDWNTVISNPKEINIWLHNNHSQLKTLGKFSNHRKFESLKPEHTGKTISTYINWVGPKRSHQIKFNEAKKKSEDDSKRTFDQLYNSMRAVHRFGRLAKFDYLTMVGKIGLAPIEPGSTYMQGGTGPVSGARLLFGERLNSNILNERLEILEKILGLYFGMQVLEDSLCNWQKSPSKYIYFGG